MLNKYVLSILALLVPTTLSNNVFISFGEKYHVTDYNINQYGNTNFYNFDTRQWDNNVDNYNYIWDSFANNFINKENNLVDKNIDFIDCSRENSNIEDWSQSGLYSSLIRECINIGKTRTNNSINIFFTQNSYSLQDFKQYSNVLTNLVNTYNYNINWFISIDTYGVLNNYYRNKLIKSIISIINNRNNTYFGPVIDAYCISGLNQSRSLIYDMGSFWSNSVLDFRNNIPLKELYYNCQRSKDTSFTVMIFALVFTLIISIILFSYFKRRRERVKYQIIEDNVINS